MGSHKNYYGYATIIDATDFPGVMGFGGFEVMKLNYSQLGCVSVSLWQVNKAGAATMACLTFMR